MEVYLFETQNVEQKLWEVVHPLDVLNYGILGIKSEHNREELEGFETVINDAKERIRQIHDSAHPLSLNWNARKTMILIGDDEEA